MIVTSVQIKTVKMQKHLYCPVFTILTGCLLVAGQYLLCIVRERLERFVHVRRRHSRGARTG